MNYTLTKYPNIFKKTGWGRQTSHCEIVINNCNEFVRTHKIRCCKNVIPTYIKHKAIFEDRYIDGIDHLEYFLNENNQYVIVTSPYRSDLHCEYLTQQGWTEMKGIYTNESSSFYKIMNRRRSNETH